MTEFCLIYVYHSCSVQWSMKKGFFWQLLTFTNVSWKSLEIELMNKNWYTLQNSFQSIVRPALVREKIIVYHIKGEVVMQFEDTKNILSCEFDHCKKVWNFVNFFLSTYVCQKINNNILFAIKLWDQLTFSLYLDIKCEQCDL